MPSITITTEEFWDLHDDMEEVAMHDWRHGYRVDYVFERGGKHYMCTVDVQADEGIELYGDDVECHEVEAHVVEKTVWEPVKETSDDAA